MDPCRRENGRGRGNWKSGPDTVWLSIIPIYSGVCCVSGQHSLVPYAIPLQAWEQLGDNCQEKSNKHFFTDKRIGEKALPQILIQIVHPLSG